jgi:Flp pilus assembly protein TadD
LCCCCVAVSGGGGGAAAKASVDSQSELLALESLIKAEQYPAAERKLQLLRQQSAGNADVWNWSGYVARKTGHLDDAFAYYAQALKLDPRHLGAHEYLGEAYLQAGQLEQAEGQLAQLKAICGQCEQAEDLAESIRRAR